MYMKGRMTLHALSTFDTISDTCCTGLTLEGCRNSSSSIQFGPPGSLRLRRLPSPTTYPVYLTACLHRDQLSRQIFDLKGSLIRGIINLYEPLYLYSTG